jgi:hypothetical protein
MFDLTRVSTTHNPPCARTNCYPLELVILIRCAKTGVTRVGLIQKGKMGYGEARRLATFTHPQGGGA